MSIKERLAAKVRRTVTVPVQVSDPGPVRDDVAKHENRLTVLQFVNDPTPEVERQIKAAKADLEKARTAFLEHFVEVEFAAGDPADVERILSTHTDDKGEWSITAAPELAAMCATDPDLRDPEWWSEQLEGGAWSTGERAALWNALITLNVATPPEHLPKG